MRPRHLLTDRKIRAARPRGTPYRLADGGGLYLLVQPGGSKLFVTRFVVAGAESMLSLGPYGDITLAEARDRAEQVRRQVQAGKHPAREQEKERARAALAACSTFEAVAREWIAHLRAEGRAQSYVRKIECSLNASAIRALGTRPINEIGAQEVRQLVLKSILARGARAQADNVRQWVGSVLDFAIAGGARDRANPCRAMTKVMPTHTPRHYAALRPEDAPEFLRRLVEYPGMRSTVIATELLMRTGLRQGTLRRLEWAWLDRKAALIRVPPTVMKSRRAFVLPLSRQAVALIDELRDYSAYSKYLFPGIGARNPQLSENTLGKCVRWASPERHITCHGMRALFKTTAREARLWSDDLMRLALAHVIGNKVDQAYDRAELVEPRRALAQWWSDTIDGWRTGGQVIPLRRA